MLSWSFVPRHPSDPDLDDAGDASSDCFEPTIGRGEADTERACHRPSGVASSFEEIGDEVKDFEGRRPCRRLAALASQITPSPLNHSFSDSGSSS